MPELDPVEAAKLLQDDIESIKLKVAQGKPLTLAEIQRVKQAAGTAVENKGVTPIAGVPDDAGPKWVENQTDLARALGVDRKTIQRHLKEEGNPGKASNGQYNLHEWRAWCRYRGKKGGKVHDKNSLECKRLLIDIAERDFDFDVKKGKYSLNSDVEKWFGDFSFSFKQVMLAWPGQLAPDLAGKTAAEVEKFLTRAVKALLEEISTGPWQLRAEATPEPA